MSNWRVRVVFVTMATISLFGGLLALPASAQEQQPAMVRVVHGLRGLVADVYLDGELVLPTFQPERSTDPLPIPPGSHKVEIRQAGAGLRSTPLLAQTVDVPAGFAGSLVAHLDVDGNPVLTAFADDTSAVPAGQTRVVVRHTADVGAVDVALGDARLGSLTPDGEVSQVVATGAYQVTVTARGDEVLTPQGVDLAEGTVNFMYLIGARADGSLGWAAVEVDASTAPAKIQTGDGSSAAGSPGTDPAVVAAGLAAIGAAILGAGWATAGRRRRPLQER